MIDDSYTILDLLGVGAMGMVYVARDERLHRKVALKLIHPDYVSARRAHSRFVEEARLMAKVRHFNVVEIYSFGEYQRAPYFVMEYIAGRNAEDWLQERVGNGELLSIDESLGIMDQVCQGVAAIHEAGTVHRDLKPTNILIGKGFRVAVTDLGLACIADGRILASGDTVSGTPAYMAPEIIRGDVIPAGLEPRVDVYSLGVLAFEFITGRLPFETDDPTEMMIQHLEQPPPPASEFRHDLPMAFDKVLARALAKTPEERTPSADHLRRDLFEAREFASAPSKASRILIADDDAEFCQVASAALSQAFPSAAVDVVRNGHAALKAVDEQPASLAVISLDLADMNGVELTAAFRASVNANDMPIVVVTAKGGASDWRLLQSLGADGFLLKPVDATGLVAMARRALDSRQQAYAK